mmetsp:Transcript_15989/g.41384  ORF Transcript_15989/g.41384 Transcript_15989/m.41384 type:complete len:206 (-) Transcript_15989:99-716(-)
MRSRLALRRAAPIMAHHRGRRRRRRRLHLVQHLVALPGQPAPWRRPRAQRPSLQHHVRVSGGGRGGCCLGCHGGVGRGRRRATAPPSTHRATLHGRPRGGHRRIRHDTLACPPSRARHHGRHPNCRDGRRAFRVPAHLVTGCDIAAGHAHGRAAPTATPLARAGAVQARQSPLPSCRRRARPDRRRHRRRLRSGRRGRRLARQCR